MRFACRITKAANAYTEHLHLLVFHDKNGYLKAP